MKFYTDIEKGQMDREQLTNTIAMEMFLNELQNNDLENIESIDDLELDLDEEYIDFSDIDYEVSDYAVEALFSDNYDYDMFEPENINFDNASMILANNIYSDILSKLEIMKNALEKYIDSQIEIDEFVDLDLDEVENIAAKAIDYTDVFWCKENRLDCFDAKAFDTITQNFDEFVNDYISDQLDEYEDIDCYASDLGYELTEEDNINGTIFANTRMTEEFLIQNKNLVMENWNMLKDELEITINPFTEPEKMHVYMLCEAVDHKITNSEFIQEHYNEKITLDKETIDKIKSDLNLNKEMTLDDKLQDADKKIDKTVKDNDNRDLER